MIAACPVMVRCRCFLTPREDVTPVMFTTTHHRSRLRLPMRRTQHCLLPKSQQTEYRTSCRPKSTYILRTYVNVTMATTMAMTVIMTRRMATPVILLSSLPAYRRTTGRHIRTQRPTRIRRRRTTLRQQPLPYPRERLPPLEMAQAPHPAPAPAPLPVMAPAPSLSPRLRLRHLSKRSHLCRQTSRRW